ncbi:MAG: hypothetical protein AB8B72_10860 [Crocinitomicaceae bacterium]
MEKTIGSRISYVDEKKSCSIVISPERVRWKEAILFAWLLAYSFVGFYMIYLLFFGMDTIDNSGIDGDPAETLRNQKIYLIVFIAFWAYFEFKVVKGFLWLSSGKELVKITPDELRIKQSIFTYGKARKFFTDNISNFDVVQHKSFSFGFDYENAFWRQGADSLIFTVNGKDVGFAKKVPEKEANLLMRLMKDRIKKISKP